MIELNRGLYMDETTGGKHNKYGAVKKDISKLINRIIGDQYTFNNPGKRR